MFASFMIGLREGFEAALIVSILVTYLVRTDRAALNKYVRNGVLSAILASALVAYVLQSIFNGISSGRAAEIFAGIVSCLAVVFVTWMIFWMKKSAKTISGDLRSRLDGAALGGGFAVAGMAFLAVVREGAETAVFFWATTHPDKSQTTSITSSVVGLLLGLALSVVLGYAFYKSAIRINLTSFFRFTGVLLTIVAAGVLAYGIHEFQEVGWLPGEDVIWLNLSAFIPDGSIQATLASALFNLDDTTSALEVLGWVGYVTIVMTLFLRRGSAQVSSATPASAPVPQTEPAAR